MKTVTVEEVADNFPALLRIVERGEELNVVRRRKHIAKIVPVLRTGPNRRSAKYRRLAWANHFAKLDAIYGGRSAAGKPGSQIIIEGRR
jgi:antitoxin (DNA-binding transcriptional repressor) of toxin-antitoxin stability system